MQDKVIKATEKDQNDMESPFLDQASPRVSLKSGRGSVYSITALQQVEQVNKDLKDMTREEITEIALTIVLSTFSVCIGLFLQMFILSINLHFVGSLSEPIYLDAIGFAIVIINCTGGYLMIGFNQGTGSFIGRAHGKNDKSLINNYFSKGVFMLLSIFILFCIIMYNSDILLELCNQEEELAKLTQSYGTAILPGILANYSFDLLRNYLNGQEIYKAPMVILALGCPFHYMCCTFLFDAYGVNGTIYATNITYILIFSCVLIYCKKQDILPKFTTHNLFWNMKDYFKETLAIALPLQIDVLGFEINTVLIGLLHDLKQFGAHVTFCNFTGMFFSFPVGMGGAFMLLTSNAVGKNCVKSVKNYCILAYIEGTVLGIICATIMFVFNKPASYYYSSDPEIQAYFQSIMIIYAAVCILDFVAQAISGVLKAIGKAKDGLIAFVLSYYVIGIPVSAYLGLETDLQLIGFWYGFCLSVVIIVIFMSGILYKTDLKTQIQSVHDKLEKESKHLEEQMQELKEIQ